MREIKFRAWNYGNNAIIKWNNLMIDKSGIWHVIGKSACISDDFILMQYTGLLDKKGVEIYEGDICDKHDEKFCSKGEVKMIHGCWMVSKADDRYFNLYHYLGQIEVIGNIYENPELLKDN